MKLIANGRIWVDAEEGAFLGYGRIELLQKIALFGSIRQAALEMKISYKQAWDFVDQINHRFDTPLITSKRGGKGGGSAVITEEGIKFIEIFKEFNVSFQAFLVGQTELINDKITSFVVPTK